MVDRQRVNATVPHAVGVGLKADHYLHILDVKPSLGFFEVHAENYMGAGGPPHAYLEAIRAHYPLSLHGVGLSIGGPDPLNTTHLARLKQVHDRYEPGLFSEHLAWSTHQPAYYNDLLPLPYTESTLDQVAAHIDQVQQMLGRQMLLENPSTYVMFEDSTLAETEFLHRVVDRTGCGLLLDVNNVFVSATNSGRSADEYLAAFPVGHVGEIHLGGHAPDEDEHGHPLLIDAHDRAVADPVWLLFQGLVERIGSRPTLVEWDADVPAWSVLHEQAARAQQILDKSAGQEVLHAKVR